MGNTAKFFIFVLILLLLGTGAYLFWYKKAPESPQQTPLGPTLSKVFDDLVISPITSDDGSSLWYFNSKGQLFNLNFADNKVTEHPTPGLLPNFQQGVWSPKGDGYIAITSDSKSFYNNKNNSYIDLPKNIQSFDWMPDGERIVYVWKSGDNKSQSLYMGNADASGFTKIKDVFWPDLVVKVSPDGRNALLVRSNIQETNSIYMVDLVTSEFKTLVDTGKNTDVKWITSDKFVYSEILNSQTSINIFDIATKQSSALDLVTTLDRVTSDKSGNIYASAKDRENEVIWKIDLEGNNEKIYTFEEQIVPRNLFLSGQIIFFKNSTDNKLYKLVQ